jgi:hypothetical protein
MEIKLSPGRVLRSLEQLRVDLTPEPPRRTPIWTMLLAAAFAAVAGVSAAAVMILGPSAGGPPTTTQSIKLSR